MNLKGAEAAKAELQAVLRTSPRHFGIERSRWRLKDLGQEVPWLSDCSLPGISQILKRLKIRLKQTISYVESPDPAGQIKRERMVQVFCQATFQPERYVLLFLDELTYYSQPGPTLKYGPEGQSSPRVLHAPTGSLMTRLGAVLNGLTGQVTYLQADKFGKLAMAEFYHQIRQFYPDRKIFVIQDNCNFHYSDNVLETAAELDIQPIYLPTYASWLNPIEKLWRWLKAEVLHGHEFAHDPQLLRQVVADFLDQFAHGSLPLLRYVGLLPD